MSGAGLIPPPLPAEVPNRAFILSLSSWEMRRQASERVSCRICGNELSCDAVARGTPPREPRLDCSRMSGVPCVQLWGPLGKSGPTHKDTLLSPSLQVMLPLPALVSSPVQWVYLAHQTPSLVRWACGLVTLTMGTGVQ